MRFIAGFIFICNILLWLIGIVWGFTVDLFVGLIPLSGFIAFIISYSVSEGFIVSLSDYFYFPTWDIFKRKLKWANGIGFSISAILLVILFFLLEI